MSPLSSRAMLLKDCISVECALTLIISTLLAIGIAAIQQSWMPSQRYPSSIQWVGRRVERFSYFRACLRHFIYKPDLLDYGYRNFGKVGQGFVMPLSSFEPIVILPQEHVKWLIDQPATVLCPRTAAVQRMGFKYVSPDFDAQSSEIIHAAIRFHLNKKFDKLQGDMFKEMQWATDSRIGTDESWNEVNLADAMRYIIFHTLVPVLAGQSLSRNEDFTHALMKSANWVGAGSIIVGQFVPVPFRSALGRLLQIPIRYTQGSFLNHLMPVFKERFQNMRKKVEDPSYSFEAPEDMTTWLSDVILKRKNIDEGAEKAFENAYKLLLGAAFASTVLTANHAFLDILGSESAHSIYQTLREEAESTFATPEDWSDSTKVLQLRLTDSTLKESLRRAPPTSMTLLREVLAKDGVTLPNGQWLRQGIWLAVPSIPIHTDERFYEEPDVFRPFRFASKQDPTAQQQSRPESCVTTSDTFLSFGHGRSACAGRQFATHIMKMLVAYITTHYDIQPLPSRPLNIFMGEHPIAPEVKVMIRRRVTP